MSLDKLKNFERIINTPHGGIKYTALKNGLYHYYSSLRGIGGDLALTFYSLPGEETEFDNDNYQFEGYHDIFISSIVSFHHFIELHIKDILYQSHPLLATDMRRMDNATLLEYLETEKIEPGDRSIDFAVALQLLKDLKKARGSGKKKYFLPQKHDFILLEQHLKTIKKLFDYRNSTLHRGDVILPYLAFDYFISQHVLPLVKTILDSEPDYILKEIDRETGCGLKVFNEILKIKFNINDLKKEGSKDFIDKIERLAHLKELGRASFNLPVSLPRNVLKKEISKL
ncbi:MAG TPA: hypothetical protein PK637_00675, partial [Flavobacteriales bacterium]|nr:hypothetical protein [Flavobacteriales bacterium]